MSRLFSLVNGDDIVLSCITHITRIVECKTPKGFYKFRKAEKEATTYKFTIYKTDGGHIDIFTRERFDLKKLECFRSKLIEALHECIRICKERDLPY